MERKEIKLMQWHVENIVSELHDLQQRLFYEVEAKMAEKGKVKPEFTKTDALKLLDAEKYIKKAKDLLEKVRLGG